MKNGKYISLFEAFLPGSRASSIAIFLLIPILGLFTGCSDELTLPEPQMGAPVFEVSAELNGQAIQWQAGVDDYYMYTNYEQDNAGVYTFSGSLAQENCTEDCSGSLSFYFRDREVRTAGESFSLQSELMNGTYPFSPLRDSQEIDYFVSFTNLSIGINPLGGSYLWEFEGVNATSSDFEPVVVYEQEGTYEVCLTASSMSCTQIQCRDIHPGGQNDCYAAIAYLPDSSGAAYLQAFSFNGTPPYAYQWSEGSTSQGIVLSPNAVGPQCVTITDSEGCSAETCALIVFDQGLGSFDVCYAGFSYEIAEDTVFAQQNPLQLGAVAIAYEAPDGALYRSDWAPQEGQGQLQILSVEPFEDNENGLPTLKLDILFSAILYDNSGNSLLLENGSGFIAIAYPG